MAMHEKPNLPVGVQRMARPPFVNRTWAALAYVQGKYNPASAKGVASSPDDFLGMYVSKADPGIGLITFSGTGEYLAFHRCGEPDATAEFALLDAFLGYEVPFAQWRIYPIGEPETERLRQMELTDVYERA